MRKSSPDEGVSVDDDLKYPKGVRHAELEAEKLTRKITDLKKELDTQENIDNKTTGPAEFVPVDGNDDAPLATGISTFEPTEDVPDSPPLEVKVDILLALMGLTFQHSPHVSGAPTAPSVPTAPSSDTGAAGAGASPNSTIAPSVRPASCTGAPPPNTQPLVVAKLRDGLWIHKQALATAITTTILGEPPYHILSLDGTRRAERVDRILSWVYQNPFRWLTMLGVYFQKGERSPSQVNGQWEHASGINGYRRNGRLLDWKAANKQSLSPLAIPADDNELNIFHEGSNAEHETFEEAISKWARDQHTFAAARETLRAAFWRDDF
ncbi:MAG: hypothetical protein LQ344_004013 [Seirophora lacunosa]|nr:MAG: hypothetical protein LQ344_004013 [Seirophora lacunosa]